MAEIKKESGVERFIKEGFSFADVKKETDTSSITVKQEVNTNVSKIGDKMDMSLVRIKTEPGLIIDCDTAPAPIDFMHHQEVNSLKTITAVKQEINSDIDVVRNNNNVTVNLLIPDTILTEKIGDIQAHSEENLPSSVDSDMPSAHSVLTETGENCLQSNISSDLIPENTCQQNISDSSNKQRRKRKDTTDCLTSESLTPPSLTTTLSKVIVETHESGKKNRKKKKGPVIQEISDKMPNEVSIIDPESSVPQTSITGMNDKNISQPKKRGRQQTSTTGMNDVNISQPKKREMKKGSQNKEKEMVVCPFCDKRISKTYFPYHARIHTDEKPFKCPKCPYTSHFKGPLDFHTESHHPTHSYNKPKQ